MAASIAGQTAVSYELAWAPGRGQRKTMTKATKTHANMIRFDRVGPGRVILLVVVRLLRRAAGFRSGTLVVRASAPLIFLGIASQ
jgi:hypothetical protein